MALCLYSAVSTQIQHWPQPCLPPNREPRKQTQNLVMPGRSFHGNKHTGTAKRGVLLTHTQPASCPVDRSHELSILLGAGTGELDSGRPIRGEVCLPVIVTTQSARPTC